MQDYKTKIQELKAFHHLIADSEDEVDSLTPEEVDAELKKYGVDVKSVRATIQAAVQKLKVRQTLDAARAEWEVRKKALQTYDAGADDISATKAQCRELLGLLNPSSPQQAMAQFRKFESATDTDWISMREDLKALLNRKP